MQSGNMPSAIGKGETVLHTLSLNTRLFAISIRIALERKASLPLPYMGFLLPTSATPTALQPILRHPSQAADTQNKTHHVHAHMTLKHDTPTDAPRLLSLLPPARQRFEIYFKKTEINEIL